MRLSQVMRTLCCIWDYFDHGLQCIVSDVSYCVQHCTLAELMCFAVQVVAADSVIIPQEPRDTGTVFGTLQLPPQTIYRCRQPEAKFLQRVHFDLAHSGVCAAEEAAKGVFSSMSASRSEALNDLVAVQQC